TPEEAGRAASGLGGRVALKAVAPGLVHKTEVGAVRLDLAPGEVARAAREMKAALQAMGTAPSGFLVQRLAAEGVEMILGVVHDAQFGPVVACGAGGVLVELLKDVAVGLGPLSERDAGERVAAHRTGPPPTGHRGSPPAAAHALADADRPA